MIFIVAVFIGITMGVFGSGGAILTLPSLIYFVGLDEKLAIVGSLVIVGIIASITALPHLYRNNVDKNALISFAPSGILTSYIGALIGARVSPDLQLSIFVLLMIIAATKMFLQNDVDMSSQNTISKRYLLFTGAIVGFFTGFIGVGGGFLIVPSLMMLAKLPLKNAVATSVVIIFMQCLVSLYSYSIHLPESFTLLPWRELLLIAAVGSAGALLGNRISCLFNQSILSKVFASLLILLSIVLVLTNLI